LPLAILATLAGSTLQSTTGFGFALVLAPAFFGVFDPTTALTTELVLGAALNLLILFTERRPRQIRGEPLITALGWALPGLVVGALILVALSKPTLQIAVGVAVVIAAAIQARARATGRHKRPDRDPPWTAPAVGFTTGVLSTTTGTSGPPLVLWFHHLDFRPHEFRDTLAAAFLALNALSALALLAFGNGLDIPGVGEVGVLLVATLAGQLIGLRLFARLDPDRFRALGLVVVVCAGAASAIAGIAAS
jgi:uncharacterized membrane protein YfcA